MFNFALLCHAYGYAYGFPTPVAALYGHRKRNDPTTTYAAQSFTHQSTDYDSGAYSIVTVCPRRTGRRCRWRCYALWYISYHTPHTVVARSVVTMVGSGQYHSAARYIYMDDSPAEQASFRFRALWID